MKALRIPGPQRPLRLPNPVSTRAKVIIGSALAIGLGTTIFLTTRRAAAATQAAQAFSISADCMTITVVDEQAAKGAATAAALVVRPSPGDDALEALTKALAVAIPSCEWTFVPPDRTFVHGGSRYTWSQIEDLIEGRTVGELSELVGATPDFVASPVPRLLDWLLPEPMVAPPLPPLPPAASGTFSRSRRRMY